MKHSRGALILLFFLLMIAGMANGAPKQDGTKTELIQAFLRDLINVNIPGERIIEKYICVDPSASKNKDPDQELGLRVYRLRMMMLGQSIKITDNFGDNIKPYKSLPKNEQDILIAAKEEENIFSFKGEQNIAFLILISNGRIASFTTIKQGSKRLFIMACGKL
jgi:hypothetical protein